MVFGFPERLFPRRKYTARKMRVFALAISWISIAYNGLEGGVSIGFGADAGAKSLTVFGIQSFVEVLSAVLVVYRFRRELHNSSIDIALERRATLGIGILFVVLTIGTWIASIIGLALEEEPDSSGPSLIISAGSLFCMILVWLPKPWIAIELNSSVMRGESACSLACIYLTIVLFTGSLIYKLWPGGWWIDGVLAIILGLFFLHQGYEMISWARNKDFNGGCCKTCTTESTPLPFSNGTSGSTKKDQCTDDSCDDCESSVRKPLLANKPTNSSCDSCASTDKCCSSDAALVL